MIEIHTKVPHCLGQDEAVVRIQQMVASLSQRFPQQVHQVQLHLKDHRVEVGFAAYGYVVSWSAEIYDDEVHLMGRIPNSAKKFRAKIEQAIVSRVEATLLPSSLPRAA